MSSGGRRTSAYAAAMGRGARAKVRWHNDRIRRKKARVKRLAVSRAEAARIEQQHQAAPGAAS
jgi:hypothetical protein